MNPENYTIPSWHSLLGQTTKQPLSNSEPQNPWKYKQLRGLRPDPDPIKKNKCMLPSIFEKHKICSNCTKSLLVVNQSNIIFKSNKDFAMEPSIII